MIFSELLVTDKEESRHCLGMKTSSFYWSCIEFYTLITYASYITYIYTSYIDCYNSLEYMFFILCKKKFSIMQLK